MSLRPDPDKILVEYLIDRAGHHLFLYPFEGFLTNEAFGTLLATRISRDNPATIAVAANEYGVTLYAPRDVPLLEWIRENPITRETLAQDIAEACNVTELAKRRFFTIARIAGLVVQNAPGKERKNRQLLTSSNLIFDVLRRYDPENLLLKQAEREVLDVHFDVERLESAFVRAETHGIEVSLLERPSLAFPLMVERVRARVPRVAGGSCPTDEGAMDTGVTLEVAGRRSACSVRAPPGGPRGAGSGCSTSTSASPRCSAAPASRCRSATPPTTSRASRRWSGARGLSVSCCWATLCTTPEA